jgi:hypothetical protein
LRTWNPAARSSARPAGLTRCRLCTACIRRSELHLERQARHDRQHAATTLPSTDSATERHRSSCVVRKVCMAARTFFKARPLRRPQSWLPRVGPRDQRRLARVPMALGVGESGEISRGNTANSMIDRDRARIQANWSACCPPLPGCPGMAVAKLKAMHVGRSPALVEAD